MASNASIDFETFSVADLTVVGLHNYATHPSTEVMCLAYAFDDEPVELWTPDQPLPQRLCEHVAAGRQVSALNAFFEIAIWNAVLVPRLGFPPLRVEQCRDSMVEGYAMGLPGALKNLAPALGLEIEKDMLGSRIMLQLASPRAVLADGRIVRWNDPEKTARLYSYCKQDVEVERAISKRLRPLAPKSLRMWHLDHAINRRGLHIDVRFARQAAAVLEAEKRRLDRAIFEVTGGAVGSATAVQQLLTWIASKGIKLKGLAKADVLELLDSDMPFDVQCALEIRQAVAKTSNAKLDRMIELADSDGLIRYTKQFHGAGTGRWAARGVQTDNMPRPRRDLKREHIEDILAVVGDMSLTPERRAAALRAKYRSCTEAVSSALRGFITPRPGNDFITMDFSNIESRGTPWLAGEEWKVQAFASGAPVYQIAAAAIFNVDVSEISKEDERRQVGKVQELAFGFGGGAGAIATMARAYDLDLGPLFAPIWNVTSDERRDSALWMYAKHCEDAAARKRPAMAREVFLTGECLKLDWRARHPITVQYWADLDQAAINAVKHPGQKFTAGPPGREATFLVNGSFLWLRIASGRVLCYCYPRVAEGRFGNESVKFMAVDGKTHQWRETSGYGGYWCQNHTQAFCCDLLADGITRLEDTAQADRSFPWMTVTHVHDEVVGEVPKSAPVEIIDRAREIFTAVPPYATGLPIAADVARRIRYGK